MVNKDLYLILGIPQSSELADVRKAYRKLALRYHPDKNTDPDANEQFLDVAEAYDVLGTAKTRAIYDQYGYDGLRKGAPEGSTGFTEPYTFHGDAMSVFRTFFATDNPFHDIFPNIDEFSGETDAFRTRKKQDPPIERPLHISLEEAYLGCIKKMKISRKILSDDGHTTTYRDKILTINVKPGWKEGTRVTFPKDGDQGPNNIPADLVFLITYKQHPRFQRKGQDLIHVADISLADALSGCIVELVTLDGRKLSIPVCDVVHPSYELRVPNEGMPSSKDGSKGDLLLKFNIHFPHLLSEEQRALVRQALA